MEGGNVWAKAGQPLVCDVNSLPHHDTQCVFSVITYWICFGDTVMCQVLLGRGAEAKNGGCPASCLHPHQLIQLNSNITEAANFATQSCSPLRSVPHESLMAFTQSVWSFYLLSRCFPGRESGIRLTFCPQQLLIYHRIC